MVVRLRGIATETIKNIVLAGIGKLVILDDALVSEGDLGAGFFLQEDDVGKKVGPSFWFCLFPFPIFIFAPILAVLRRASLRQRPFLLLFVPRPRMLSRHV